jgi:exodeoxyribonuclease-3
MRLSSWLANNVMATDLDVYAPERWRDDALFRPEVRNAYAEFVKLGWSDSLRELNPEKRIYTFWKYFRDAFARDAGLRIDHLLLSPALKARLVSGGVAREVRSWEKTSDHAPAWIELADSIPKRSFRPRPAAAAEGHRWDKQKTKLQATLNQGGR